MQEHITTKVEIVAAEAHYQHICFKSDTRQDNVKMLEHNVLHYEKDVTNDENKDVHRLRDAKKKHLGQV